MHARLSTVRQLTQPAVQDVVIDTMISGHRGDRHAGDSAGGHQLSLELGAVGAAAAASLGVLVVGVWCPRSFTRTRCFYIRDVIARLDGRTPTVWRGAHVSVLTLVARANRPDAGSAVSQGT